MSMLSAQADELRGLAGDGSMEWVAGPIRAATLRDAADTILSLRDRAQELQAEFDKMDRWHSEELQAAMAENAKLRELVADLYNSIDLVFWDGEAATREQFKPRMRELGVEVE